MNEPNESSSKPKTIVADGFAIHATAKQLLDLIRIPENFGDQILDAKSREKKRRQKNRLHS
jgi:hypothetical protein